MITILNAAFLLDPSTMPPKLPLLPDATPAPAPHYGPILDLIERYSWKAARKTNRWGQPQTPHQYIVRNSYLVKTKGIDPDPKAEADYIELYNFIYTYGRIERYGKANRPYLYPGDGRKYWALPAGIDECYIINRMWAADDIERMRKTGQL